MSSFLDGDLGQSRCGTAIGFGGRDARDVISAPIPIGRLTWRSQSIELGRYWGHSGHRVSRGLLKGGTVPFRKFGTDDIGSSLHDVQKE
jgi:hypothetical protein